MTQGGSLHGPVEMRKVHPVTCGSATGRRVRALASDATPGRYVMVAVSDTGVGMDAATRARLFEPFFTTKDSGKGSGLGLSVVARFVRRARGYLHVHSEPGKGARFEVYLPRTDVDG